MTHQFNTDDICMDCCIPKYLAEDYMQPRCPYTDADVSRYISAFYPLYEKTLEKTRAFVDAALDYFGE